MCHFFLFLNERVMRLRNINAAVCLVRSLTYLNFQCTILFYTNRHLTVTVVLLAFSLPGLSVIFVTSTSSLSLSNCVTALVSNGVSLKGLISGCEPLYIYRPFQASECIPVAKTSDFQILCCCVAERVAAACGLLL
jgi:hypothetical protein